MLSPDILETNLKISIQTIQLSMLYLMQNNYHACFPVKTFQVNKFHTRLPAFEVQQPLITVACFATLEERISN